MNQRVTSLKSLLADHIVIAAQLECNISGMSLDSRTVKPGDVFFAMRGGEAFIEQAKQQGAVAIVGDTTGDIVIPNLSDYISGIASHFYGHPSQQLHVIGITGTNGKSSCAHFMTQVFKNLGKASAMIGTLGFGEVGQLQRNNLTTPDPITLQALLAQFVEEGITHVAMEVSSHALDQGRVNGVLFDTAVFTNLSPDHLDYHPDMHSYGKAKQKLFHFPSLTTVILNADDPFSDTIERSLRSDLLCVTTSTIHSESDIFGSDFTQHLHGICATVSTPWGQGSLDAPLFGAFNLSNCLAVLGACCCAGFSFEKVLRSFKELQPVCGRMECLSEAGQPQVLIDYAHTPDALQQALVAARELCEGKLWCVFGCGGDRYVGKRALMGEIAEKLSDCVIVTSDNPRHEDPIQIMHDIRNGMSRDPVNMITDRKAAIESAISQATSKDVILIAGKGHEEYQIIQDEKQYFSDHDVVRKQLSLLT